MYEYCILGYESCIHKRSEYYFFTLIYIIINISKRITKGFSNNCQTRLLHFFLTFKEK